LSFPNDGDAEPLFSGLCRIALAPGLSVNFAAYFIQRS